MNDIIIAQKYLSKKNNADSRGIEFSLSFKRYKQLMNAKRCFYTKALFIPGDQNFAKSLDRIDSTVGYTDKNTVACTVKVNQLKNNLSKKEIKLILKKLI